MMKSSLKMGKPGCDKGFTLLESLIVVSLLSAFLFVGTLSANPFQY
ncbi:MAG: type II secretion system protein, partial [Erysipelotrichales bacterium]